MALSWALSVDGARRRCWRRWKSGHTNPAIFIRKSSGYIKCRLTEEPGGSRIRKRKLLIEQPVLLSICGAANRPMPKAQTLLLLSNLPIRWSLGHWKVNHQKKEFRIGKTHHMLSLPFCYLMYSSDRMDCIYFNYSNWWCTSMKGMFASWCFKQNKLRRCIITENQNEIWKYRCQGERADL